MSGEKEGGVVEGKDVGSWRCEEWRRFKDDDIVWGDEVFKVCNYGGLNVTGLHGGSRISVLCVASVIGECVHDNEVVCCECELLYFGECLR